MNGWKKEWVTGLCAKSEPERALAGAGIFNEGRIRAGHTVAEWRKNEELRRLLGATPEVTVGIAVNPESFAAIREANGTPRLAEVHPEQDASEFELHFADGVTLDILTPREPGGNGAIARFLAKQGEGIQQVEFRCVDVDRATTLLRDAFGVNALYPETRPGADGTRVNFFLVTAQDGTKVLIELYERAPQPEHLAENSGQL